ncbi:Sperm-tail PG-rich repeat-containing protein 2 [Paramecium bursaria]
MSCQPGDVQKIIANVSIVIPGMMSMTATFIVIMKYILNKELRNFEFMQIAALNTSDFIQASSISLPVLYFWITEPSDTLQYSKSGFCIAQGFLQLVGCLAQFLWTLNIAISALRSFQNESKQQYQRRKIFIYCLGLGLPLTIPIIPLALNQYGYTGDGLIKSVCFIQNNQNQSSLTILFCFQLPMIIVVVLNLIIYRKIIKEYLNRNTLNEQSLIGTRLMQYPLILILCQGWFVIYLFLNYFKICTINFQIWCYLTSNLTGFCDAILYGIYSSIITYLFRY